MCVIPKEMPHKDADAPVARVTEFVGAVRIEAECLPHTGALMKIGDMLYAAPVRAPAITPLTPAEIERGREQWGGERHDFAAGVRFAERAHGISAQVNVQPKGTLPEPTRLAGSADRYFYEAGYEAGKRSAARAPGTGE